MQTEQQKELRILILEDSPLDAELMEHVLRQGGLAFTSMRVDTREAFVHALEEFKPDLIISDYHLPGFDGLTALKTVRQSHPGVPVIMVTGALPDIEAVEFIHAGAKDYILKDRLARLAPAVQRVLSAEQGIRARKQAEEELRLRAQMLDSASDTIFLLDLDGNFIYLNETAWRSRGYTRDELMGINLHALNTPEYAKLIETRFREITEKGHTIFESAHRRKDGSVMPVEISARLIETGGRKLLLSVIRDITERKRAEQALSASEEQYHSLVNNIPDVVWTTDKDGNTTFISQNIRKVYGYSPGEIYADPSLWFESIHPEDRKNVEDAFGELFTNKRVFDIEYRIRRKDGEWIWLHDRALAAYEKKGKWYADGIFTDITERKRADEAVRRSEAAMQEAQRLAKVGSWEWSPATNLLTWSEEAYRIFDRNPTLPPANIEEVPKYYTPESWTRLSAAVETALTKGIPYECDAEVVCADGSRRWVAARGEAVRDASGAVTGLCGTVQDITERRQMEIALRSSNRALKVLGACNATLVHTDEEGKLLQEMCDLIVEKGGYRQAWIGYAENDGEKTIRPVAYAGFEDGYLETLHPTWADVDARPFSRAIRTRLPAMVHDIAADASLAAWHGIAKELGMASAFSVPMLVNGDVLGVLSIYAAEANAFDREETALLQEMAGDIAFGLRVLRLRQEQQRSAEHVRTGLVGTIQVIASMVEMRDPYTAGHQQRVADLAASIAVEMGLPEDQVRGIHLAGTIHDLGKVQTPAEILSKPGKLSASEFGLIKDHPQNGYEILKDIEFPWPIAQMVLQHHEKLDGSGYPQGLKGSEILLEAKIMTVADVMEAMSSHRPYRPGMGIETALAEITKGRGTHYDLDAADACVKLFKENRFTFK